MTEVLDARHLLLEKLYYGGYTYLVRSHIGGGLIATQKKPIRTKDGICWLIQGKECLIQDYGVLDLVSMWDEEPWDIMLLVMKQMDKPKEINIHEAIKEIVEDTIEDLFDDLLAAARHAQTQSDIVDDMESSLWKRGDKLIEKLNIMLKEKEETSEIKGER